MTPLFKKLNFKNHAQIVVLNLPSTLEAEVDEMTKFAEVKKDLDNITGLNFCIVFATQQNQLDAFADQLQDLLKGDPILWVCYPKATSKNYKCDFNRDNGWEYIAKTLNMEPVRQIAIDDDWSALRFRKVAFIKTITRRESFALTNDAKQRTKQKDL